MLIFAISLLFTAGAAFAMLVILGMLGANRRAIRSALAGHGAFAGQGLDADGRPPLMALPIRVGPVRHGRAQVRHAVRAISPLRAAA